jgi:hypothetical protein
MQLIKNTFKALVLSLTIWFWFIYTDNQTKLFGLIVSLCYSLLEFTWIGCTVELPDGEVRFRPFSPERRKAHTVNISLI